MGKCDLIAGRRGLSPLLSSLALSLSILCLVSKIVIRGFANKSFWASLDYDGDGSWIHEGMLAQSLIIIHDGSYMREISPIISSTATMIYYTIAKVRCKCT
jgi:hypothetical protein